MESSALSIHPFTLSKTLKPSSTNLHRQFLRSHPNQTLNLQLSAFTSAKCIQSTNFHRSREWLLISFAANFLRDPSSTPPNFRQLASISSSAVAFGSGGGGDGSFGGTGGGGGDGGFNGGETESKTLAAECDEVTASSPDVIVLDVGGMTCGGCASSVKRILESQPQVSSASVNLATETAVVWVKPEVLVTQNWKQQVGENLAKHLTNCGFKSNLRGEGYTIEGEVQS